MLCARRISRGQIASARGLLLRMLRLGFLLSAFASGALLLIAAPAARFFFAADAPSALLATSTHARAPTLD